MAMPRPSHRTITVFPSAWTERILVGRNRSEARKRAPKGLTNSSRYSCLLAYSLEASEWPSIRQTMSVAQVSGNGSAPSRQASNVSVIVWRLASVSVAVVFVILGFFVVVWAGPRSRLRVGGGLVGTRVAVRGG